jgi:DNA-binding NtrC family response regulator
MKQRILIVDDQPEWVEFAKDELREYKLEVAENSETALQKLDNKHYDLIISNIRRLDVLQAIAEKYPDNHVVVMTISPSTREAATAYRLGAMDYFPRSFRSQSVLAVVEEAMRKAIKQKSTLTNARRA